MRKMEAESFASLVRMATALGVAQHEGGSAGYGQDSVTVDGLPQFSSSRESLQV